MVFCFFFLYSEFGICCFLPPWVSCHRLGGAPGDGCPRRGPWVTLWVPCVVPVGVTVGAPGDTRGCPIRCPMGAHWGCLWVLQMMPLWVSHGRPR